MSTVRVERTMVYTFICDCGSSLQVFANAIVRTRRSAPQAADSCNWTCYADQCWCPDCKHKIPKGILSEIRRKRDERVRVRKEGFGLAPAGSKPSA